MPIKLYLTEPEERTDGSVNPPREQAWFLSRGAMPLSNETFLAWEEFLTRSEIARYVYCQHCGAANELKHGGGIKDDSLPSDVLTLKQRCIEEGRADWLSLRTAKGETALFASKGKETFLIAQWGEGLHTQDEIIQGALAKKRLKHYANAEVNWSLGVFACALVVIAVIMTLMSGSQKEFDSHTLAVLSLAVIPVPICIGIFERLKNRIRRQLTSMF